MKIRKRAAILLVIICSIFLLKEGVDYYIHQAIDKNTIYTYFITNHTAQMYGLRGNTPVSRNDIDLFNNKEIFGFIGMYVIIARLSDIKSKIIILIKNRKAQKLLKSLREKDYTYLKENLDDRVNETYFKVEEAWSRMDLKTAQDYMSDNIYRMHRTKTEWMKLRKEKYIVQNVNLLKTKLIGLEHYNDNSKDVAWFYIKSSMTNYIITDFTEQLINGNNKNKKIIEFWKFNKKDGNWVLDEIIKINEKDKWRNIGVFIEPEEDA